MITVTLGTIPFQFNRAIQWIDQLIDQQVLQEDLFVQHGVSDISQLEKYPFIKSASTVEYSKMKEILKSSRLVISHAGQGSTRELAAQSVRFILLPRLSKYNEHIDDHQLVFAESVSTFGVRYCLTLKELEQAILDPPSPLADSLLNQPKLTDYLLKQYPPNLESNAKENISVSSS